MAISTIVVRKTLMASAISLAVWASPVLLDLECSHASGFNLKKELRRAERGLRHERERAEKNVKREADRAVDNVERTGKRVEEAVSVAGHTVERSVRLERDRFLSTVEAVADGKLDEALKASTVDYVREKSRIGARAAQDSSYIRAGAQIAATAYGGPGGAAAFASWLTLETTGDFDASLKAGVLSGASVAIGQGVMAMPDVTVGDHVARAAVGGGSAYVLASAAGATSSEAEKALVMAVGQQAATAIWEAGANANRQPDEPRVAFSQEQMQPATSRGYCASGNVPCAPGALDREIGYNRALAPRSINRVGLESQTTVRPGWLWENPTELSWSKYAQDWFVGESGPAMTVIGAIPGMNGMATFHDEWMIWHGDSSTVFKVVTIAPAMVVTYAASGAEQQRVIQDAVIEEPSAR